MKNSILIFFILFGAVCTSTCSLPTLEKPQCTEARDAVKRFYSFHVASDMPPVAENRQTRQSFLTPELDAAVEASIGQRLDYFTATEDYPKAFRVGSCSAESNVSAELQVLLLWRDDVRSEQKEVRVKAVKSGDKWLISKVSE